MPIWRILGITSVRTNYIQKYYMYLIWLPYSVGRVTKKELSWVTRTVELGIQGDIQKLLKFTSWETLFVLSEWNLRESKQLFVKVSFRVNDNVWHEFQYKLLNQICHNWTLYKTKKKWIQKNILRVKKGSIGFHSGQIGARCLGPLIAYSSLMGWDLTN